LANTGSRSIKSGAARRGGARREAADHPIGDDRFVGAKKGSDRSVVLKKEAADGRGGDDFDAVGF